MPTARHVDSNGYLTVKGCPISSWGIFEYSAGQIGLEGDPDRIVKVYRPKEALNNPKTIESFKNLPLIDDHEFLSGDDPSVTAPEDYGVEGIITGKVWFADDWLRSDLKVFSRKLRESIDAGKTEVSLGFDCDYILSPGIFNGEEYEVVQDNLCGNHIALVDKARVTGARVLDGKAFDFMRFDIIPHKKELPMSQKNKGTTIPRKGRGLDSAAVEKLKGLLPQLMPALQQFLQEEAQEPQHQAGADEPDVAVDPMATGADEPDAAVDPEVGAEPEVAPASPEVGAEPEVAPATPEGGEADLNQVIQLLTQLCQKLGGGAAADEVEPGNGVALDEQPDANGVAQDEEVPEVKMQAADSATLRKEIYADMAAKDALYRRVSPIIGAFDHASMSCDDLVDYSNKKLGISAKRVHGRIALDSYLMGVSKASVQNPQKKAADAALDGSNSVIDNYLKGE
ncbi:DUF2213 domain-containing protein [Aeromonas phage Gekk3-15]